MLTCIVVFGPLLVFATGLGIAFGANQYHASKEMRQHERI